MNTMDVSVNVRRIRKEKGLTLDDVAAAVGVSKGFLSRVEVEKDFPESGWVYRALAMDMPRKLMEPFTVVLPQGSTREPVQTDGDEFVMVLEGRLRYVVGDHVYEMGQGDSLYFRGELPHFATNVGQGEARVLAMYALG